MDERPLAVERCPPAWLWALLAVPAVGMAFTFVMPFLRASESTVCPATSMVYVRSLREGADVWRPAVARELAPMIYEILAAPDGDPTDEAWEFAAGTVVRCEERALPGGNRRVAVALAERPPSSSR